MLQYFTFFNFVFFLSLIINRVLSQLLLYAPHFFPNPGSQVLILLYTKLVGMHTITMLLVHLSWCTSFFFFFFFGSKCTLSFTGPAGAVEERELLAKIHSPKLLANPMSKAGTRLAEIERHGVHHAFSCQHVLLCCFQSLHVMLEWTRC